MKIYKTHEIISLINKLINDGTPIIQAIKISYVKAYQATKEEKIITILRNQTTETQNTAKPSDWIITNPDGEQHIVTNENFMKKYIATKNGYFKATDNVQKFIEIPFDISFICAWDEKQFIAKGGMLNISNLDDIYGVAKDEFRKNYQIVNI